MLIEKADKIITVEIEIESGLIISSDFFKNIRYFNKIKLIKQTG
jgi:hypothetical protein